MRKDTNTRKNQSRNGIGIGMICSVAIACLALVCLLWGGQYYLDLQNRTQGAYTLRDTITDASVRCYAIEGQYPTSIAYLEDNYGLSINYDDYEIVYEVFASNMPPTIEVKVK